MRIRDGGCHWAQAYDVDVLLALVGPLPLLLLPLMVDRCRGLRLSKACGFVYWLVSKLLAKSTGCGFTRCINGSNNGCSAKRSRVFGECLIRSKPFVCPVCHTNNTRPSIESHLTTPSLPRQSTGVCAGRHCLWRRSILTTIVG